jgi:flagellar basal-body rod modification protein FlgD
MFMTLLVAQLKNQDPLAPQDGAQFVAQLAQFNSLDQLIGIRQSIEELLARSNNDPTNADTNRTNSVQSFQLT